MLKLEMGVNGVIPLLFYSSSDEFSSVSYYEMISVSGVPYLA